MSEMIERVAEAIMRRRHGTSKPGHLTPEKSGGGILLPHTIQEEHWRGCLKDAAVVIPAMRLPTDEMVDAARKSGIDRDPEDYWLVMIDAALA